MVTPPKPVNKETVMSFRIIKEIPAPDAYTILVATCGLRATPSWNDQCLLVHFGEDGVHPIMVETREYFITDQNERSGQFQDWYFMEQMDEAFADL